MAEPAIAEVAVAPRATRVKAKRKPGRPKRRGPKPGQKRSPAIAAASSLRAGQLLAPPLVREGALGSEAPVLTLLQICQMAGLRYKVVMSYLAKHKIELQPNNGKKGRTRRYSVGAVKDLERVFSQRVKRGSPGGVSGGGAVADSASVMGALRSIAQQLRDLRKELARPMKVRFER